ncbi:PREDICTED: tRNA (guanine(9)-N1)-methyltransferase [Tarenaya hassleriana]|uniref:tRNA (guanine(9)-N1)-methyltransferase n=1 Tax=Tarenaya hassleriana TaxID=28532 RepID=UPI00053C1E7B|nr:PREDICTED: tRNA (guanine(9)-N1)-methyltransferase [Tarenaya hassleriana]
MATVENDENTLGKPPNPEPPAVSSPAEPKPLSKNAQKKLLKQKRYEAKKAEKKAQAKELKKQEVERKRKEWQETLTNATEEEKLKLIESRQNLRRERMEKRSEDRERKIERLTQAKETGQNVVVDLEFAHLMSDSEIHSLVQQIMYCYAMNGRSACPCHLWLTGCRGQIDTRLQKLPGFDKWMIEKEDRSYVEVMADQKENLVYLTADSETILDELDPKKIYIVGGLVDRNRFKGITMQKAQEQGIETAKLPIADYLKMSSSQVLTVNQVVEILMKFLETKDWKTSFFAVIPQRKRCESDAEEGSKRELDCEEHRGKEGTDNECGEKYEPPESKKVCIEVPPERS